MTAKSPPFSLEIVLQLLDHTRRVPRDHRERLDTLRDHAACAHSNAPPDRDASKDVHAASYPAIVVNVHFFAEFGACDALPYCWVDWMGGGINRYPRADENTRTDGHFARIEHHEIRADERISPDGDVEAIVEPDGTFDPGIAAELGVIFLLGRCLRG